MRVLQVVAVVLAIVFVAMFTGGCSVRIADWSKPGERRLAKLGADEQAVIYFSTFAYVRVAHYALTFRGSDPTQVEVALLHAQNRGDSVIDRARVAVTPNDLTRLDSVLSYYRAMPDIGCRVEDHIRTEWYRDGGLLATDLAIDGSCRLRDDDWVLPLDSLVHRWPGAK
jgi:hypothetical protein